MMRLQYFGFKESSYERPVPPWVCQHAMEGRGCSVGPTQDGRCVAGFECFPQRSGDHWLCTRNSLAGGKCGAGPLPDGKCSRQIVRCAPLPNVRLRRGRVVGYWILGVICVLLLLFGSSLKDWAISPGPLSFAHGAGPGECDDCHQLVRQGVAGWVKTAFETPSDDRQSQLCVACHRLGDKPLMPHTLPQKALRVLTERARSAHRGSLLSTGWLAVAADERNAGSVACARCHPEHRGHAAGLTEITDAQCQACHVRRFRSLATGHPEFEDYPFERRTRIIFDHYSHRGKYYPDAMQRFECDNCHLPDVAGEAMLAEGYDGQCGACHEAEIRGQSQAGDKGVMVLAVPGLDLETIADRHLEIGGWPEDADREVPPLMNVLLWADPEYRRYSDTLRQLDLLDLSDADELADDAVEALAWSVKRLYRDLAVGGQRALQSRLESVFGKQLARQWLTALSGTVAADAVAMAATLWFPHLDADLTRHSMGKPVPFVSSESKNNTYGLTATGGILGVTTIAGDAGEDTDEEYPEVEITAEDTADAGGWYRDYFALFYRPSGHGDRFLRGWLDFLSEIEPQNAPSPAANVWELVSNRKAPGHCVKCHSIDPVKGRRGKVNWYAKHRLHDYRQFTRFSHAVHLSLVGEQGCLGCHRWIDDPDSDFLAAYQSGNAHASNSNFHAVDKGVCLECHQPSLAGQGCLTCHNYHVGKSVST